jgi:MoxR-like ATPase
MTADGESLTETVSLTQAKDLIKCLAHQQSLLLLSPPGLGKSDIVAQAAAEAGLPCRSLLGTQIAPEDVSGVPRIVGERSVFCPPRVLLPEQPEPFCLFLDELPACAPDVQKAFYSLLLERRIGEHRLPAGTWVVAAGNRSQDRALVRTISSALVNRVIVLQVRVELSEWLVWAEAANVRREIREFVKDSPAALLRDVPREPVPFSTPRAWASLSRALDLAESAGILDDELRLALAAGRLSEKDAEEFCSWSAICRAQPDKVLRPGYHKLMNMGICELELSVRATNFLESDGINTVAELIRRTRRQLLELRNSDAMRVTEIEESLASMGLALAE